MRIIGAEEAAEALERGDVAQRRGDDEPRYGDRPTSPAADGPRPVLRFPLGLVVGPARHRAVAGRARRPDLRARRPAALDRAAHRPGPADPPRRPRRRARRRPRRLDELRHLHAALARRGRAQRRPRGLRRHAGVGRRARTSAARRARQPRAAHPRRLLHLRRPRRARAPRRGRALGVRGRARGALRRGVGRRRVRRAGAARRPACGSPTTPARRAPTRPTGGDRDMGLAVAVGRRAARRRADPLQHRARARPWSSSPLVVVVAAAELFGVLRQVGYEPVTLAGIAGTRRAWCSAPTTTAPSAIPTVLFLTTAVCLLWYLVGRRRRGAGDEHRRHAARRAVGRAVRLVRRAHAGARRARHRDPARRHPRHRRLRHRRPVRRPQRRLEAAVGRQPEQDVGGPDRRLRRRRRRARAARRDRRASARSTSSPRASSSASPSPSPPRSATCASRSSSATSA